MVEPKNLHEDLSICIVTCRPKLGMAMRRKAELERRGFRRVQISVGPHWNNLSRVGPWDVGGFWTHAQPHWADPYFGRTMTVGEIGCSLSHRQAWEITANDDITLYLEEDAELTPAFENLSGFVQDLQFHKEWSIGYVSQRNIPDRPSLAGRYSFKQTDHPLWTSGYFLNLESRRILLDHPLWNSEKFGVVPSDDLLPAVFRIHRDQWMNDVYGTSDLPAYSTVQRMVDQSGFFSESQTEKSPYVVYPPRVRLITVATDLRNPGFIRFQQTAERYGFSIDPLGVGNGDWDVSGEGGGQKIVWFADFLNEAPIADDEKVMFTDSYDVLFAGNEGDVLFNVDWDEILFAAEKFCWPDKSLADRFAPAPYPYLNSGCYLGKAGNLRTLLNSIISKHGREEVENGDDQGLFTEAYLDQDEFPFVIRLDGACTVFNCVNGASEDLLVDKKRGTVKNTVTGTNPAVIHFNGPVSPSDVDGGEYIGGLRNDMYEIGTEEGQDIAF